MMIGAANVIGWDEMSSKIYQGEQNIDSKTLKG